MTSIPRRFRFWAVLVAMLACALFLPGLGGGFILDDKPNIVENVPVHVAELTTDNLLYAAYSFQPGNGTRALPMLSFALDYWRAGLDARAFKVSNLLIHALTALALAFFLRRLLEFAQWRPCSAANGALVIALVWAIHPLQVSSVLYVVQRMQTLVTLFMVLALWAYLCMRQAQVEGRRSRRYGILVMLCWVLGFACKEDAALLPAYALALELTILRFAAASPRMALAWKRGWLVATVAAVVVYLFMVVPYYWHWDAYPGRVFSSYERLLTQGRVLAMYIGQVLLPLPCMLPFYYDGLVVSRGWLEPWTTLPAWLFVFGLLASAWWCRSRRPIFALGVFLFFAGHFMTSNVISLELAFEHRNHLPLIGALLVLGDLGMAAWKRWGARPLVLGVVMTVMVSAEGASTVARAHAWGDPVRFARASVEVAPHSARAWLTLCGTYFERSGGKAGNPWLDQAIAACEQGAQLTNSAPLLSNVVIFKTVRGDVTNEDWARFLERLRSVPMNAQNAGIAMVTLNNLDRGIPLDEDGVLQMLEIISSRADFTVGEYLRMGAYVHNETRQPGKALVYMRRAVEFSAPDDEAIAKLFRQLDEVGKGDWVKQLKSVRRHMARDDDRLGAIPEQP